MRGWLGAGTALLLLCCATPTWAATISSGTQEVFGVGRPPTATTNITVTATGGSEIVTADDIRISIPAALNMTWDSSVTTVTLSGTASGKVSTTVSYEASDKRLVLDVTSNFGNGQDVIVSGLKFRNFTAASAAASLTVDVNNDATSDATDDKTKAIGGTTASSGANQYFAVGQADTSISTITLTEDAAVPTVTSTLDLRIRIPSALGMTWVTSDTSATLGGTASGRVSTTVTYEDGGKTLVLDVTSNFAAGETLTVGGLSFGSFTAQSASDNLELVTGGSGRATVDEDDKSMTIGAPTVSSASDQTFTVGQAATAIATITVTEGTQAILTAANDLRITIPSSLPIRWDTTDTTASLGGTASGKASTTVTYEDSGRTLVINVTSDLAAGETLTLSGLSFTTFTSVTGPASMTLAAVSGNTAATDSKALAVVAAASSGSPGSGGTFRGGGGGGCLLGAARRR